MAKENEEKDNAFKELITKHMDDLREASRVCYELIDKTVSTMNPKVQSFGAFYTLGVLCANMIKRLSYYSGKDEESISLACFDLIKSIMKGLDEKDEPQENIQ